MEDTIARQKSKGYPSDFLSPTVKQSKEYSLKWGEFIDSQAGSAENGFYSTMGWDGKTTQTAVNRAYARAKQPNSKYKPMLGVKDKKVRNDPGAIGSFRVQSWENLPIMPKFINVLIGNLMKQNNTVGVKAVDAKSLTKRAKKKIGYEEHIQNRPFLDSITAKTGIKFQAPVQGDIVPMPENVGEIDLFMDLFDKEDFCLIAQDILQLINEEDQMPVWLTEVFRDLIETSFGVTRTFRIGKKVKRRRCEPERMVMSASNDPTCKDIKYIGEYWDITIGKLKEIAGDQFTEEEYEKIAETASNNAWWKGQDTNAYYKSNLCYPWDNTKVTVLDAVWWSPDYETYQIGDNQGGNVSFSEKDFDWWDKLHKKGVTEQSFNEKNESKVVRYALDNQYQCMWIKGTKFIFNHGKSKDMLRNESSVGECIGPFTVYNMKDCIVELMIPLIDNIQVNWLQYQHHAAKSRPAGLDIEFSALQDMALEGAGGKKMTPKQLLELYFDTGILLWRRKDAAGSPNNWRPINELNNGLSPASLQHYNNIAANMALLRDLIGLNELTDASTPNSEMGKAVATFAFGATKDALRTLHFAADYINLGTADRTLRHVLGMAQGGLAPEYTTALGLDDMERIAFMSDLSLSELGCYTIKEPSDEQRAVLQAYVAKAVDKGWLKPYEAFEIENEKNIYRSIRLMKMYDQQKMRQQNAKDQADIQANGEQQRMSAQATSQLAAQDRQAEAMSQVQVEWEKAKAQDWANAQQASRDAFLIQVEAQLKAGLALSLEQERRLTEIQKANITGQYQMQVAAMKPKPTGTKGPSRSKR